MYWESGMHHLENQSNCAFYLDMGGCLYNSEVIETMADSYNLRFFSIAAYNFASIESVSN